MVVHTASSAVHTVSPLVAETQRRVRAALDHAGTIDRLSSIDEQRFSAVYIGLVDLELRLSKASFLSAELHLPELHAALNDLLHRAWRAAALLEAMSALFEIEPTEADAFDHATSCSRHLTALSRGSQSLFA